MKDSKEVNTLVTTRKLKAYKAHLLSHNIPHKSLVIMDKLEQQLVTVVVLSGTASTIK